MSDAQLLPCPFCANSGDKSRLNVCHVLSRYVGQEFCVECTNCGAEGPATSSEARAVSAWNTRADLHTALTAERDALRAELDRGRHSQEVEAWLGLLDRGSDDNAVEGQTDD